MQAFLNTDIAKTSGADGVFLINHKCGYEELTFIYENLRFCFQHESNWWIGMNYLDLNPAQAIKKIPFDASGLWVDNAGIDENKEDPFEEAKINWQTKLDRKDWRGIYFGGVAFKYQKEVLDLDTIASRARNYMDVITTSGKATGLPPGLKKIEIMRRAIKDFPLAVASGVNAGNIRKYLPLVDCFLVATGVSRTFFELDEEKVKEIVRIINSY